jgi:hypothetical protein
MLVRRPLAPAFFQKPATHRWYKTLTRTDNRRASEARHRADSLPGHSRFTRNSIERKSTCV